MSMQLTVAPLAEVNERGGVHRVRLTNAADPGLQLHQGQGRVADQRRARPGHPRPATVRRRVQPIRRDLLRPVVDLPGARPPLVPVEGRRRARGSSKRSSTAPARSSTGAVTTAFPEGTTLTKNAVPVVGDVAQIDLSSEVFQADDVTLQRMQAQLVGQPRRRIGHQLREHHREQQHRGHPRSHRAVAAGGSARPRPHRGRFRIPLQRRHARAADRALAADRVARARPPSWSTPRTASPPPEPPTACSLCGRPAPSPLRVDARPASSHRRSTGSATSGRVPAATPAALTLSRSDGSQSAVLTSWPEASSILSLAVSRDGTRSSPSSGSETNPACSSPASSGTGTTLPVSLGDPQSLAVGSGTAVTSTWVDDLTVATLTTIARRLDRRRQAGHRRTVRRASGPGRRRLPRCGERPAATARGHHRRQPHRAAHLGVAGRRLGCLASSPPSSAVPG